MLFQAAEDSYRKGLIAFTAGRHREAMALFEAAIELETRFGRGCPQPRYLSHYGLCLAFVKNELGEAVRFCREAVSREEFNPDLRLNHGLVLMRSDRRKEAYHSFIKGLSLEPRHADLRRAIKVMGIRKRPPLPFLSRKNPINVLLGRFRSRAA